jgi:hypothetical protein
MHEDGEKPSFSLSFDGDEEEDTLEAHNNAFVFGPDVDLEGEDFVGEELDDVPHHDSSSDSTNSLIVSIKESLLSESRTRRSFAAAASCPSQREQYSSATSELMHAFAANR